LSCYPSNQQSGNNRSAGYSELDRTRSARLFRPKLGSPARPQGIPNAHSIGYSWNRTVAVVEGVTLATSVTGTITMLIIGVLLNVVGLGIFCWHCSRSQPMHCRSSSVCP
jgi:hypothetical protein